MFKVTEIKIRVARITTKKFVSGLREMESRGLPYLLDILAWGQWTDPHDKHTQM